MRAPVVLAAALAAAVAAVAVPARAGELDLNLGLQATATGWPDDAGGGPTLGASWWFRPWIGATFIGKEHFAQVDDRFLSYFSVNAALRQPLGRVRLGGTLGLVHQHETPRAALEAMPFSAALGVADGIRHRAGARAGLQLALPFHARARGDVYVALELDGTLFTEEGRGPRWMSSAGVAVGFTHDFARGAR
jgi:hypothetical protein